MSALKDIDGKGPDKERAWDEADLLVRLIFFQADCYSFGEEREAFMCRIQSIVNNYQKQDAPSDALLWFDSFMENADMRDKAIAKRQKRQKAKEAR